MPRRIVAELLPAAAQAEESVAGVKGQKHGTGLLCKKHEQVEAAMTDAAMTGDAEAARRALLACEPEDAGQGEGGEGEVGDCGDPLDGFGVDRMHGE
jgi:hypothetical protein